MSWAIGLGLSAGRKLKQTHTQVVTPPSVCVCVCVGVHFGASGCGAHNLIICFKLCCSTLTSKEIHNWTAHYCYPPPNFQLENVTVGRTDRNVEVFHSPLWYVFGRLTGWIANSRPFITTAAAQASLFVRSRHLFFHINCLYLAAIPLAHDVHFPSSSFSVCACSVSKRPWQPVHSKNPCREKRVQGPVEASSRARKKFFNTPKWPHTKIQNPLMDS